MFNLGIDVLSMCTWGVILVCFTGILVNLLGLVPEEKRLALSVSAFIATMMVAFYVLMAKVLDLMLGIYW